MPSFWELVKVVFLGIIEGVTEWLPVSSTGHMLLFDAFVPLAMEESFKEMFFVVIQLGAILAVVCAFFQKMLPVRLRKNEPFWDAQKLILWCKVALACVPSGLIGLFFDDFLEASFGGASSVAMMLIVYGVAFILIEAKNKGKQPKIDALEAISWREAFFIGCFQVLSLIPGTSRSGATILGAMLLGVSRTAAAEFTFFLAVPTMAGASLVKLLKFGFSFTAAEGIVLAVGSVVAFLVSLLAIDFLMRYVKRHSFAAFGWYRIVLGLIVLAVFAVL